MLSDYGAYQVVDLFCMMMVAFIFDLYISSNFNSSLLCSFWAHVSSAGAVLFFFYSFNDTLVLNI